MTPTPTITKSLLTAALCLVVVAPASTQERQPTLDELLDLAPPTETSESSPSPETPPPSDPETSPTSEPSEPAAGVLPEAAPTVEGVEEKLNNQKAADAFAAAVQDMARVAERLDQDADPGIDTQRLQESILARLDQIIEAAEQQQSSGGAGGGQSASNQDSNAQNAGQQPGQQPGEGQQSGQAQAGMGENAGGFSPGQVGPVDPGQGAIDEVRSEWGSLPPRLRDELTNGLDEPYSPVYRNLTEAYYRRLAEEASE